MINEGLPLGDSTDIFLKTFEVQCATCRFPMFFVNAEHLDHNFYKEYCDHLKKQVASMAERINSYEAFLAQHDLPFGIVYELKKLKEKHGRG